MTTFSMPPWRLMSLLLFCSWCTWNSPKVRNICEINCSPCACPEIRIVSKVIVHPVVDVDPMVLVSKVRLELVSRLFIRFHQLPWSLIKVTGSTMYHRETGFQPGDSLQAGGSPPQAICAESTMIIVCLFLLSFFLHLVKAYLANCCCQLLMLSISLIRLCSTCVDS